LELHPLFQLLDKREQASEEESLLAAAVLLLSVQPRFTGFALYQVYDEVKRHRDALRPPTREIMEVEQPKP
jgi:hypothetical protein